MAASNPDDTPVVESRDSSGATSETVHARAHLDLRTNLSGCFASTRTVNSRNFFCNDVFALLYSRSKFLRQNVFFSKNVPFLQKSFRAFRSPAFATNKGVHVFLNPADYSDKHEVFIKGLSPWPSLFPLTCPVPFAVFHCNRPSF